MSQVLNKFSDPLSSKIKQALFKQFYIFTFIVLMPSPVHHFLEL